MRKGWPTEMYISLIFALIGVVFSAVGFLFISKSLSSQVVEVPAIITDIQSRESMGFNIRARIMHTVYVQYTINGEIYDNYIEEYAYGWEVGDTITIYYDPNSPQSIHGGVSAILGIIFASFGGLFLTVAVVFLIFLVKQNRKNSWLMQHGRRECVPITEIQLVRQIKINHHHPYRLVCQWQDPLGNSYDFISRNLLEDPTDNLNRAGITDMPVYIDEKNPQNYTMDHSPLERLAIRIV